MVSIAKTSRSRTFSLFKLQLPWKCSLIFLSETFYFYFLWVPWLEVKFILLFKYIYHAWGKISSERDIFILAWGMLQVMCILNTAKNTVILSNFLVLKFCGKAQFPHSFGRITRNYAQTVPFHKISTPGN